MTSSLQHCILLKYETYNLIQNTHNIVLLKTIYLKWEAQKDFGGAWVQFGIKLQTQPQRFYSNKNDKIANFNWKPFCFEATTVIHEVCYIEFS